MNISKSCEFHVAIKKTRKYTHEKRKTNFNHLSSISPDFNF